MLRPILACIYSYKEAEIFTSAGWDIDFLNHRKAAILWSV